MTGFNREIELVNIVSGEKKLYNSLRGAEKEIGRSATYIKSRTDSGDYIIDLNNNFFRARFLDEEMITVAGKTQLCWDCKKACGGCSWSRSFRPVPGWVAEESSVQNSPEKSIKTFNVIECPEFVKG